MTCVQTTKRAIPWHRVCVTQSAVTVRIHQQPFRSEESRLNLRQIVELTAIVSAHSPNLIEASGSISQAALRRYEDYSHIRVRNWLKALEEIPREIMETSAGRRHLVWQRAESTLIDVLAGGLVARVWGAILTACDRSRRTLAAERIGRTALAGQMQAQQGVLRLLVDGPHLTRERVVGLDRLRRRIERWTDLLLGHLVRRHALGDFAFDLERSLDFGEEQLRESWEPRHNRIWDLYFVCLRSAFPDTQLPGGIQGQWREELMHSILGCFPQELFLEDGVLRSIRLNRVLNAGARREGPPMPTKSTAARLADWRGSRRRITGEE